MAEQAARVLNIAPVINHWIDGHQDARETVIDVLTELRHFAADEGVDFEFALDLSDENYREEAAR